MNAPRLLAVTLLLLGQAEAAALDTLPTPPVQAGPEKGELQPDPPARAGPLASADGEVESRFPGEDTWQPALRNLPMATGSAIRTQPGGRALLELPGLNLALESGLLEMARLDDEMVEARLPAGRLGLLVQGLRPGDRLVVATPRGEVMIRKPGRYLVDAGDATEPMRVSVYEGQAEFQGRRIVAGEALAVSDDAALEPLGPPSPLLAWAASRGPKGAAAPEALAFMPGAGALGQYGQWSRHADYGDVWRPAVPPGWAPFTQGRWVNVEPWGWNWVDEAPWGFAPAHYGRWYQDAGAWYWAPQPLFVPRLRWPAYAPAVVRFSGWPEGRGRFAGPVGWAPLAPREAFWGPRRFSPHWQTRVNATAMPQGGAPPPPGAFARLANAGAAVMVPGAVLRGSAPVGPSIQRMNPGFGSPTAAAPLAGAQRWAGAVRPGWNASPAQVPGWQGTQQGRVAPPLAYAAPLRGYAPPYRAYATPAPSYVAPPSGFSSPSRGYASPARPYSPPVQTYAAPRSFSPPPAYAPPPLHSAPQAYRAPPPSYSPPPRAQPSFSAAPRPAPGAPSRGGYGHRR